MKFLGIVLAVVPLALAVTNDKKGNMLDNYFGDDTLRNTFENIVNMVGSDATKAQCVGVCPFALNATHVPAFIASFCCLPMCDMFQYFVQKFHLVRDPVNVQTKRDFFLTSLPPLNSISDRDQLLQFVQDTINQYGNNATEQQVEALCHQSLAKNTLVDLNGGCPKELVRLLQLIPDPGTPGAAITTRKRRDAIKTFARIFHLDETKLRTFAQTGIDTLSGDQIRQYIETLCHGSANHPITDSMCDTVALAFQKLMQKIHIHQVPNPIVG